MGTSLIEHGTYKIKYCIFLLSDKNDIRTYNHLVRKRTLNHLAKLAKSLNVRLRTKWLWVQITLLLLKLQIPRLFWTRGSLTFKQLDCRFTLKRVRDMIITYSYILLICVRFTNNDTHQRRSSHRRSSVKKRVLKTPILKKSANDCFCQSLIGDSTYFHICKKSLKKP